MTIFGHSDPMPVRRPDDDPETSSVRRAPSEDLDESISQFVRQIDDTSMMIATPAGASQPDSAAAADLHPVARRSIDFELDRIVRRLDVLHASLERANAAQQAAPKPVRAEPVLFAAVTARRTSLQVFSSSFRSSHRRDYLVGLSISTANPIARGFPRVWHIMALILAVSWSAIWIGARRTGAPEITAPSMAAPAHPTVVSAPAEPASTLAPPGNDVEETEQGSVSARPLVESTPKSRRPPAILREAEDIAPPVEIARASAPPAEESAGSAVAAIRKIAAAASSIGAQTPGETPAAARPAPPAGEERAEPASLAAPESQSAPPVPTIKILPAYPEDARLAHVSGRVDLVVSIDENGKVTQASPVGGPALLHAAAVEAMMQWHFRPAIRNGINVPATAKYSILFAGED